MPSCQVRGSGIMRPWLKREGRSVEQWRYPRANAEWSPFGDSLDSKSLRRSNLKDWCRSSWAGAAEICKSETSPGESSAHPTDPLLCWDNQYNKPSISAALVGVSQPPSDDGRKPPLLKVVGRAHKPEHDGPDEFCRAVEYETAPGAENWTEEGRLRAAIEQLGLLVERGFYVSTPLMYRVLKLCIAQRYLPVGRLIHALIFKTGYQSNTFLANHIIRMYASHGLLREAAQVFTSLPTVDTFLWSSIILAHAENGQPMHAIRLYAQMRQSAATTPDNYVLVAVLKACACAEDLASGKQVHADILRSSLQANIFVGNSLIDMYAKCGSLEDAHFVFDAMPEKDTVTWTAMVTGYSKCGNLEDARKLFERMPTRNLVTWNAMITGYAQHGLGHEALSLYAVMQQEDGPPADLTTFASLAKACASSRALNEGKDLHSQIQIRGLQGDVVVGNSLVDMYSKCGSIDDARQVFDTLPTKNVVTWTAMIAGYAEHGLVQEALSLYRRMQEEGITPADHVTYVCLLRACASIGALHEGKQLHCEIQQRGLESDVVISNCLVDMYAKCGSLQDARKIFDNLPMKTVVTWNAMLSGYAQQGCSQEAFSLYVTMEEEGLTPADAVTFVCLLKACASFEALHYGKKLHSEIQDQGLESNVVVGNSLVDMYAKCGSIEDARKVFDTLKIKDVVTWTAMIAGYAQHGLGQESLSLYASMQQEGIYPANHVTFVCLLNACASIGDLKQGKNLHFQIQERELQSDVIIGNCLVDMYAKCGSLEDARSVFDKMTIRDVGSWNAMLAGYAQHGFGYESLALYASMQAEGITPAHPITFSYLLKACASAGALHKGKQLHREIQNRGLEADVLIGNCLVDMFSKCGSLQDACEVFDRLPDRDVVTWNAMIAGYAQHGSGQLVLQCYDKMQLAGIKPDIVTFVSLLSACSHAGLVDRGMKFFESMSKDHGLTPEIEHYVSMVDLFGRAGYFTKVQEFIGKMPTQPDLKIWLCLLSACRKHGNVMLGQQAFDSAVRLQPKHAAAYVLMSQIYAAAGLPHRAMEVHALRQEEGARKEPGQSWIEYEHGVRSFMVGECEHPEHEHLYDLLEEITLHLNRIRDTKSRGE